MKGNILFTILVSCVLYKNVRLESVSKSTIESFIIHYLEDNHIVPVRIELNADQQTEHVSSIGGETLYDFNQRKVAYKDLNSSQCFIAEVVEESLQRDRRKLRNLQKGIVRGFFMPTFTIQEEFNHETDLPKKFGIRITEFCNGNTVSFVKRQQRTNRIKRNAPGEKGQFTHHSYGHYGLQSNNYAHYGQETYMTGNVDKDGNVRNHQVSQHQVRSEGSKSFPDQSFNVPQVSGTNYRTGFNPQFQTQSASQQTGDGSRRQYGTDASGQFSLQTAQESGYQLNLPLGLRTGNAYRGGIRSSGQYSVGGPQPQIATEYHRYPAASSEISPPSTDQSGLRKLPPQIPSIPQETYMPSELRHTGLPSGDHTKISDRGVGGTIGTPSYHDQTRVAHGLPPIHETRIQGQQVHPGISIPVQRGGFIDHRIQAPGGILHPQISDSQTDSRTFIAGNGRQPGIGYESSDTRFMDRSIVPGRQIIPSTDNQRRIQQTSLHQPLPGGFSPHEQRHTQRLDQPFIQTTALQPPIDQKITTDGQMIPSRVYQPGTFYPGLPGYQTTSFQPDTKFHQENLPAIPGHTSLPGQLPTGMTVPGPTSRQVNLPGHVTTGMGGPAFQTTGMQKPTVISTPGYHISSSHPDSRHQQYVPGGPIAPHHPQSPDIRYPTTANGMTTGSQISPRPPSSVILDRNGIRHFPPPGSASTIPSSSDYTAPGTMSRFDETARFYTQSPSTGSGYLGGSIPDGRISPQGVPISTSRDITITGMQTGDARYLQPRGTDTVSSEYLRGHQAPGTLRQSEIDQDSLYSPRVRQTRIFSEPTVPRDRTASASQIRPGISRSQGRESASSQTQIQTNSDGTAAEASAAGKYRGLGSQTQVQGGYAGNGSFSAQAQSGFTGGVVQSQVQGNSQGGLSGSSAQVERLGEAQSQVQVGQPSGSASSSAQGRFTGGITQVQAQSGKTGGSAGAQSQSSGLSSSHVQVNIGGKDIREQDRFQGSVSASVHGGLSSGQSQTQLQGNYYSGRTYVATAQGGFDSTLGFQGQVPPVGSLPSLSDQSLQTGLAPGFTMDQRTQSGTSVKQSPASVSPGLLATQPGTVISDRTPETSIIANQTVSTPRLQPPSHQQPLNNFIDQRQAQPSSMYPSHLTTRGIVPQQGLMPSTHHVQTEGAIPGFYYTPGMYQTPRRIDSTAQHPVLSPGLQQPSYLIPSSQLTVQHPYSTHQTDLRGSPLGPEDAKLEHGIHILPSYTNDQNALYPPGTQPGTQFPSISPDASSITGQRINGVGIGQPSEFSPGYQPGLHVSPPHLPEMRQPGLSGMLPVSQQPVDRSAGVPTEQSAHFQPSSGSRLIPNFEEPPHMRSRHSSGYPLSHIPSVPTDQMPSLARPDYVQQPSFQQGFYQPHQLMPGKPPVSPPRPEILPSQQKTTDLPGFAKPSDIHYTDSHLRIPQQPGFYYPSQLIPGQPQISPPHSDTLPSQQKLDELPVATKPDDRHYIDSRAGMPQPGLPQISPPRQHDPQQPGTIPVSRIYPPSPTSDRTRTELPGVSEPDSQNCCEALRNLKRRCCGTADGKQDEKSPCCKPKASDFDFSSEDDIDGTKGNGDCRVVKAICYIVYKPVGKARVCKPTQTNGC